MFPRCLRSHCDAAEAAVQKRAQHNTRTTTTTNYPHTLVRHRSLRRPEAQGPASTVSCMGRGAAGTHASWQKGACAKHGWASVPPTASQNIAASSVDAAWGSGHHQETHMWGTKSLPSPHATNYHAVAYEPTRRRTTCACHTRDQTHTHKVPAWHGQVRRAISSCPSAQPKPSARSQPSPATRAICREPATSTRQTESTSRANMEG